MDILTLQQPRRFTASSSQRLEELVGPSGLPPDASIAGCLSSRRQPEEWKAALERLGQERSRIGESLYHIPAPLEESLFEELASAMLVNVWIEGGGYSRSCADCVFLTSPHHGSGPTSAWGQVYLVQLKRTYPAGCVAGQSGGHGSETWAPVVPDTDRAYTVQQMARAWETIGRPITEDDIPLSVDPDDYPLF